LYQKIRVGAVSYLNTKPLTYGFEQGMMAEEIELSFAPPAALAKRLLDNEIDVALVPVAALPSMKEYHIISNYCIGANGKVASVAIFSEVPLADVKEVYLDFESRTSVALAKILLEEYWKVSPQFLSAEPGYEQHISGTSAGLIIGDRALKNSSSTYKYDLAEGWKELTGLPFIFAAWVSNKKMTDDFIERFNEATSFGFLHLDEVVKKNPFQFYDLHSYYTNDIDYILDADKMKAMVMFLNKIAEKKKVT